MSDRTEPGAGGQAGEAPRRTAQVYEVGCGVWVLQLTVWRPRRSAEDRFYHLMALQSAWGRAFRLQKLQADGGESYSVLLGGDEGDECSCPGFQRWGHCKHTGCLAALQKAGKLDAIPAPPVPAPPRPTAPKPAPAVAPAPTAAQWGDDL